MIFHTVMKAAVLKNVRMYKLHTKLISDNIKQCMHETLPDS